ncbi:MAG: hypothetical protein QN187_04225 [Armatimonadota bacterium]|nr:hypothetical protein [Armatimonadota bacterium]MDR7520426.1 hypothetical protein [Armatimonadota bacterium]MDR7549158.1 hypothetical protein [Armatimonadota bacterium]
MSYYLSPPTERSIVSSSSMDDRAFLEEWPRESGAFGLMAPQGYAWLRDRLAHEVLVCVPSG